MDIIKLDFIQFSFLENSSLLQNNSNITLRKESFSSIHISLCYKFVSVNHNVTLPTICYYLLDENDFSDVDRERYPMLDVNIKTLVSDSATATPVSTTLDKDVRVFACIFEIVRKQ